MELKRNDKLITKKYKEYFIPTILMTISSSMATIVDGIIVGNLLGADALAAVNVCIPMVQLITAIAVLLGVGGATVISVAKVKRDNDTVNQTFTTLVLLAVMVGLLMLVCQAVNPAFFCRLLTTDEQLYPLTFDYYRVLLIGTPLIIIVTAFGYVLRADGRPKYASVILISSNVINLLLDVVLIKVFDMGISGAALATVLGYAVGLVLLCLYLFSKKCTLAFNLGRIGLRTKDILSSGFSPAISGTLIMIKLLCINHIVMNLEGSSGMVSFSVCLSCLSFVSMLISGASQTMMPILSTCYGEKDYSGVNMVIKRAFFVIMASTLVIGTVFELVPKTVLEIFGVTDPVDLQLAVPSLRLFVISLLGTAIVFLTIFILVATQKKRLSLIVTLLEGLVIIIPGALILSGLFGINGVWFAFILSEYGTVAVIYLITKGKASWLYKNDDNKSILELSITKDKISEMVSQTIEFLKNLGFSGSLANRIGVTIEEMIDNISRYSKNDKVNMDVVIRTADDGVVISFCDDGAPFNPLYYPEDEQSIYAIDNIRMITALASHIDYQQVIGLNKTIIYISKDILKSKDISEGGSV